MEIDNYTIGITATFLQAMTEMDRRGKQILLVVDTNRKLQGTITDGDLRRAVLRGYPLTEGISGILNNKPITATRSLSVNEVEEVMLANGIHHLPIVDTDGIVVGLHTEDYIVSTVPLAMHAVLMVGGLGRRLGKLTTQCPKPMLQMGGKPILHTIVEQLRSAGIHQIHMAVNYLAEQITDYFGDGSSFGVAIKYLEEREPLGTAGALKLLPKDGVDPILVMNGDILTRVNFPQVLRFHNAHKATATMCVREFGYQVPYGVVRLQGVHIESIEEKPATKVFVNSGIYIVKPTALDVIPDSGPFQMPELFCRLRENSDKIVAYPIVEYWKDIGSPEEFHAASEEFDENFRVH